MKYLNKIIILIFYFLTYSPVNASVCINLFNYIEDFQVYYESSTVVKKAIKEAQRRNSINNKDKASKEIEHRQKVLKSLLEITGNQFLPKYFQDRVSIKKISVYVFDLLEAESQKARNIFNIAGESVKMLESIFGIKSGTILIWMFDHLFWDVYLERSESRSDYGFNLFYEDRLQSIFIPRDSEGILNKMLEALAQVDNEVDMARVCKAYNVANKQALLYYWSSISEDVLYWMSPLRVEGISHELAHHFMHKSGLHYRVSSTVAEIIPALLQLYIAEELIVPELESHGIKTHREGVKLLREINEKKLSLFVSNKKAVISRHSFFKPNPLIFKWFYLMILNQYADKFYGQDGFIKALIDMMLKEDANISNQRFVELTAMAYNASTNSFLSVDEFLKRQESELLYILYRE
ncbi:MAG: hypothetical protein ABIA04_16355 [Pseudomonadota bacterium]